MSGAPTPERRPVIVKLGGSVITRKREVERLRPKILARLARELVDGASGPLVVLHGAGSFGHPGARRFGLAQAPAPGSGDRQRVRGAAVVAAEVRRLHVAVLRALIAAGGNPTSVPMATHAYNRTGELVALDPAPFQAALDRGLSPVSFGDVVPDEAWGSSILSADTIATALVKPLGAARVVFVSDVPGILVGERGGRRSVAAEVNEAVLAGLRPTPGATDVTGGIRGKASAMQAIALAGADACLISGLSDGALRRAVRGDLVYGSWTHAARG